MYFNGQKRELRQWQKQGRETRSAENTSSACLDMCLDKLDSPMLTRAKFFLNRQYV